MYFPLLVVCLIVLINNINGWFYCGKVNYCEIQGKPQSEHLACDPTFGDPLSTVKFFYPMTRKLKRLILAKHNEIRDKVASGTEITTINNMTYPPCTDMRELIWDVELEYMGRIHANHCWFGHDKCRAVKRFPYCGENLGTIGGKKRKTFMHLLNASFDGFYKEKNVIADTKLFASIYVKKNHDGMYGHYSQITNHLVTRVGCSAVVCDNLKALGKDKRNPWGYMLSCVYDHANMHNVQYEAGPPQSNCKRWKVGKSKNYKHLCDNKGQIFPYTKT